MKRNAFTLIELLVVIAIIAILAAIMFPVFSQAKLAAKRIADLSNMKQIATGIMIYQTDYDDRYPQNSYWDPNYNTDVLWSNKFVTGPYIKNQDILSSPATNQGSVNIPSGLLPNGAVSAPTRSYFTNHLSEVAATPNGQAIFGTDWPAGQPVSGPFGTVNSTGVIESSSASQSGIEAISELFVLMNGAEDVQRAYAVSLPNTEIYHENELEFHNGLDALSWARGNFFGAENKSAQKVFRQFAEGNNFVRADTSARYYRSSALFKGEYLNPRFFVLQPGY